MATLVTGPAPDPPPFPARRWTVAEYRRLVDAGAFSEQERVELLEGLIVSKMTHNPAHDSAVQRLLRPILSALPDLWDLRVQSAIDTSDSEPEPDLAVVRGDCEKYRYDHPTVGEVGLVIEVADSSLRKDRAKGRIYAEAGIPSYWIINLTDHQIEVFSEPDSSQRRYTTSRILKPGDVLSLMLDGRAMADLSVERLLPPE